MIQRILRYHKDFTSSVIQFSLSVINIISAVYPVSDILGYGFSSCFSVSNNQRTFLTIRSSSRPLYFSKFPRTDLCNNLLTLTGFTTALSVYKDYLLYHDSSHQSHCSCHSTLLVSLQLDCMFIFTSVIYLIRCPWSGTGKEPPLHWKWRSHFYDISYL